MRDRKQRTIKRQLENIDERLRNAEEYVARNVNVEGKSFLHFEDWQGKSGHPLWMKNHMIPVTLRGRAKKERALRNLVSKAKDKRTSRRNRHGTRR
jgi:hypothetical protein